MRYAAQLATFGCLTGSPTAFLKVHGSVEIGVRRVSTRQTSEGRLVGPVLFVGVPTFGALPARVARIDRNQRNPSEGSLVRQESSQLKKGPRVQNRTLLTTSRDPFAYAGQFFDGKAAFGAFSDGNDLLRNAVINVSGEAPFLAGKHFQSARGGTSLFLLEFAPQSAMAATNRLDRTPAEVGTIARCCNVGYAKVNSKKIIDHAWAWVWNIAGRSKVELGAMVDQIGLTLLRFQKLFLAFSGGVSDLEPSGSRPNTYRFRLEAENTGIVADGSVLGEPALRFLVQFVGIGNLSEDAHNDLSTERESLAGRVIEQPMQRKLRKDFTLPRLLADPVATGVSLFNRIKQRLALAGVGVQSYFGCKFQHLKYIIEKGIREEACFASLRYPSAA